MITTERLLIDELKREDVDSIIKWERNIDILIKEYDFIDASKGDPSLWYKYRMQKPRLKSYTIKKKTGEVVGFLSIRNINRILGSAILGITFNEKYLGQGYGTEALTAFLHYFFNTMNMKTMILDVGKYNFRALRCYKKIGFKITKEMKIFLESKYQLMANAIISDPEQKRRETYIPIGNRIILIYYRMKLKRNDFNKSPGNL